MSELTTAGRLYFDHIYVTRPGQTPAQRKTAAQEDALRQVLARERARTFATKTADKRGWRGELGDVLDMLGVREC